MEIFILLILAVPAGIIALFAMHAALSQRIGDLERQVEALRADIAHGAVLPQMQPAAPMAAVAPKPPAPEPEHEHEPEPEPEPEPWPDAEPEEEAREKESFGSLFERFVAGRLLVWIGGAALVGAAILLIKYSIEIGLLTPQARMIGAAVFGLALVGAGEAAPRIRRLSDDPRVAQALIGAGIVTLYATPYGSHVLYGLIDARTAALAMFLVSVAALVLSLRHGAAAALMGLLGGFLTPALVGDPSASAIPLLVYLTLLNGAVFGIAWRRGWTWLAAAAVVLSFLWSAYLLGRPPDDAFAAGFFVIALAVAAALLRLGGGREMGMVQPLAIGLAELAVLVGRADLGLTAWLMFGGLAAASGALSLIRSEHRFAPPAALLLALICIGAKSQAGDPYVPWAGALTTLLFAGVSIPLAACGDRMLRTATACAALAGPALILRLARPELLERPLWGALAILLAAAALSLAWLQRESRRDEVPPDTPLFLCAATAAGLLGGAVWDLLPGDLVAAGWLAVALAIAFSGRRLAEPGFTLVAIGGAAVAVLRAFCMVPELWRTAIASLAGVPATAAALPAPGEAMLALALPALLLIALGRLLPASSRPARRALAGVAGLFALAALYVLAKQVFAIDGREDFALRGFGERVAITQSLFLTGWLLASRRLPLKWFDRDQAAWLGGIVTLVAALRLIWFDMLLHNPLLDEQWVGAWPVLNLLLPCYLLSAFWLYSARRRADAETRSGFWLAAFLAALILAVMLTVRQLFHGPWLTGTELPIAEVYSYSLAGLLLSVALLLAGIRLPDKAVRLAGLALLTATIVKVFASDAAALEGILRILSFFGLGVGLIGVALLYGPVLRAEGKAQGRD